MVETQRVRSQPEVWNAVWQNTGLTDSAVRKKIQREEQTLRWDAIRKALTAQFSRIEGLRTIELGAGTGDVSVLRARVGAQTTLFDGNERALEIARFQFGVFDIKPEFVIGDFLALDPALRSRFDVAVSYPMLVGPHPHSLSRRNHVPRPRA